MEEIRILGLYVTNRIKASAKVQELLTKYGCYIKTRLGLHEVATEFCSESGLIILELFGAVDKQNELENELHAIEGLQVQKMVFNK